MKALMSKLRDKLREAVYENLAEGLLLSGGLDSSILAALAPDVKAVTVTLESGGRDLDYAKSAASWLNIDHYHKTISVREAINSIPTVVKVLKSFDPAIPNDLAIYFGLEMAKEKGLKSVMTGDGGDEIFAGYSFMHDIDDLESYIRRIAKYVHFSSKYLGKFLEIEIRQPFLDKAFIEFALSIGAGLKVKEKGGKTWGKWILRKAFEDILPSDIIWQDKRPIEQGSGFSRLRDIIESKVSDREFKEAQKNHPIKFMSREHLFYYQIYRDVVGEIPAPRDGQKQCPGCGAGLKPDARHCQICGWCEKC